MSIEATYHRLSPVEFRRATATQEAWQEYRGSGLPGISIEQILQNSANPDPEFGAKILAAFEQRGNDSSRLDISKDWHVIYYLLTGSAKICEQHKKGEPLHNVIFGGLCTGVQTGYGPVRYFDHELISEISDALSSLDRATVESRFEPETFAKLKIYAEPDEDAREMIFDEIDRLRDFFIEANASGEIILAEAH